MIGKEIRVTKEKDAVFFVRVFVLFFLIFGFVSVGMSIIIYRIYRESELNTIVRNESKVLDFQKLLIEEKIINLISDVEYLSSTKRTIDFVKHGYDSKYDPTVIYKSFLSRRKIYNCLRLIDLKGNEKLRINYKEGTVVKVPREGLKKNIYPDGTQKYDLETYPKIFFSEVKERGNIPVPVINAGKSISGDDGSDKVALILSYPLENLYRIVYETGRYSDGVLYFINDKNEIVSSEVFYRESFDSLKQIINSDSWFGTEGEKGYLINKSGIISYVKFHFPGEIAVQDYTLVSFIDSARLDAYYRDAQKRSSYFLLFFILLSLFISFVIAVFMKIRRRTRNELLILRIAFSQSANAIVITDSTGSIKFANSAFESITGYSIEELKGQNPRVLKSGYHGEKFYRVLWKTISSGNVWHGTFLNKKKDGSKFWEKATITPVKDEKGRIIYYIAVKEDITENKKIENELKLERERLELARIDAEFAREEAENANKLKSAFLANISHEIRTPMNGILGFARLLIESETDNSKIEKLGIIINSGSFLLEMINDILDFSKIEAGEIEITPVKMRIRNVSEGVIDLLKARAETKGIKINLAMADNVPSVLIGDENKVRQIMINIVANALKFTSEGFVKVAVNWKERFLEIAVEDTGIGIPEERFEAIFQPFKQQDSSTSRMYGGTGLGLAISKRYAEIMGGNISVSSRVGEGTTFTITLPLEECSDPLSLMDGEDDFEAEKMIDIWESRLEEERGMLTILHGVIKQLPHRLGNLYYTARNGDYSTAKKITHSLKGITGNLKMYEIYERVKEADEILEKPEFSEEEVRNICRDLYQLSEKFSRYERFVKIKPEDIEELEPVEPVEPVDGDGESLKILAADDDEGNRLIIKEFLRVSGCHTVLAENGRDALEKLGKEHFDILIIDIQMPVMDGFEAVEKIRADKRFDGLYIIAVTGNVCEGQKEDYLKRGFDECLSKPIEREILLEKVARDKDPGKYGWIVEELSPYVEAFNAGKLLKVVEKIELNPNGRILKKITDRIRNIAESYDTNALTALIEELKELQNGK